MINLIPPVAKKRVVLEYWIRTVSLWSFLFGTAVLVTAFLLIPINSFILNQESYLATGRQENKINLDDLEQKNLLLIKANQQATILLSDQPLYSLQDLLPVLSKLAVDKIDLQEITLKPSDPPSLTLAGQSPTRENLVEFRDSLEQYKDFLVVDLPINYLIKDTAIAFIINIVLATSTKEI